MNGLIIVTFLFSSFNPFDSGLKFDSIKSCASVDNFANTAVYVKEVCVDYSEEKTDFDFDYGTTLGD